MGVIKTCTNEFEKKEYDLLNNSDKEALEIVNDLGKNLIHWKREYEAMKMNNITVSIFPTNSEEIVRLKKELEIIKQDRDILKKVLDILLKSLK